MKNILLIITLFIGICSSQAQDSTNTATWQETINWIKKYKEHLEPGKTWYQIEDDDIEIEITNYKLRFYGERKATGNSYSKTMRIRYYYSYSIDLTKLTSITNDYNSINLYTSGSDVKYIESLTWNGYHKWRLKNGYYKSLDDTSFKSSSLKIDIADREILDRYVKAVTHLAKLAIEKREAERKASGDKF